LADTVGLAGPAQIRELFSAVNSKFDYLRLACICIVVPTRRRKKVLAAYDAAAAVLIRHWADWVDAPSRKMPCGKYRHESVVEALQQGGAELAAAEISGCVAENYSRVGGPLYESSAVRLMRQHGIYRQFSSPLIPGCHHYAQSSGEAQCR